MDAEALRSRRTAEGLPAPLAAMWHAARGDWNAAHEIAQSDASAEGALVHAYLHRLEGDLANADYWYRRAGRPRPKLAFEEEWAEIVAAL